MSTFALSEAQIAWLERRSVSRSKPVKQAKVRTRKRKCPICRTTTADIVADHCHRTGAPRRRAAQALRDREPVTPLGFRLHGHWDGYQVFVPNAQNP